MNARTLSEIAALCGAELEGDGSRLVTGPAALADARPDEVSFLAQPRYAPLLATTRAAGVLVRPDVVNPRDDLALLRCEDPNASFSRVVRAFAPPPSTPVLGIHPTAVVHAGAELGEGLSVGPFCVIEAGARIGRGCVLGPRVVVGAEARVGAGSVLHAGVVLYPRVVVGERCILHAACVIGSEGFGFEPAPGGWAKIPQCGTVEIEDEVEVGAGSTIDRARFGATRIGRGAKIDNLVQIGHNCVVGAGALLCAQVGLAGSTRIGRAAVLAGQVGVAGHLEIGDGARIAAQTGVFGDLEGGLEYLGYPARPRQQALRELGTSKRLERMIERVRRLEARLAELESEAG